MMRWLLDTCVLSELARPQPDAQVVAWLQTVAVEDLALSVITTGEILFGVAHLPKGRRQDRLARFYHERFRTFSERVLPITEPIAAGWAALRAQRQNMGRPLPVADGLIAATARHHGLTLATRNIDDFTQLELSLWNPWHV